MIDREFVKLNTSIQTGSNAKTPITDEQGNIEATIELRLPENLFSGTSRRKIDKVDMQTSKMRISMQETPIAQLPLVSDDFNKEYGVDTTHGYLSSCQLDVYPFGYTPEGFHPPIPNYYASAFPNYKQHLVNYKILQVTSLSPLTTTSLLEQTVVANVEDGGFPTTNQYYQILKKGGALRAEKHLMNLFVKNSRGTLTTTDGKINIKTIGALEQMIEDALANAITYACTNEAIQINVYLVNSELVSQVDPPVPDPSNTMTLEDSQVVCYWKAERDVDQSVSSCTLRAKCKPKVTFKEQSITISYDTATFNAMVPVIWNVSYINNFETPETMSLDVFRKEVWSQPPVKRQYQYGVTSTNDAYNFTLAVENGVKCALMNIIGNKIMKDTFSFLPWIPIDLKQMVQDDAKYQVDTQITKEGTAYKNAVPFSESTYFEFRGTYAYITTLDSRFTWRHRFPNGEIGINPWIYTYKLQRDSLDIPENRIDQAIRTVEMGIPLHTTSDNPKKMGIVWNHVDEIPFSTTENKTETSNDLTLEPGTTTTTSTDPYTETDGDTYISKSEVTGWLGFTRYEDQNHENPSVSYPSVKLLDRTKGTWLYPQASEEEEWKFYIPNIVEAGRTDKDVYDIDENTVRITHYWNVQYMFLRKIGDVVYSVLDDSFEWQPMRDVEEETTVKTVSDLLPDQPMCSAALACPNLDTDNTGEFYILDGGAIEVKIGEQEPIITNPDMYTKEEQIDTTTENAITDRLRIEPTVIIETEGVVCSAIISTNGFNIKYPSDSSATYYSAETGTKAFFYAFATFEPFSLTDPVNDLYSTPFENRIDQQINITPTEVADMTLPSDFLPTTTIYPTIHTTTTNQTTSENEIYDPLAIPGTTTETITSSESTSSTSILPYLKKKYFAFYSTTRELLGGYFIETGGFRDGYYTTIGGYKLTDIDNHPYVIIPMKGDSASTLPTCVGQNIQKTVTISGQAKTVYYQVFRWSLYDYSGESAEYDYNSLIIKDDQYMALRKTVTRQTNSDITTETTTTITAIAAEYFGNVRLNFIWENLPIVVMSPISSLVLTLNGMKINQETQPINITQGQGSSLTATIPVIENFYSMAQTLRDLHDELVVVKDSFSDCATYTLPPTSGLERTLTISAKYIDKDGSLHQIYIPPNGVFSLQLTFGVSFYLA